MKENTIGNRIRKIRVNKEYTQENMAIDLGISAGAYAKIERGETDASASRLLAIANILEVDITLFFHDPQAPQLGESHNSYNFASKKETEQLGMLIKQLHKELEQLKTEIGSIKKSVVKGKK